jgi:hypothetical protein
MAQAYKVYLKTLQTGTYEIPIGAFNWSVANDAGIAYVNGELLPEGLSIEGDDRGILGQSLTVSCTGARVLCYYNK